MNQVIYVCTAHKKLFIKYMLKICVLKKLYLSCMRLFFFFFFFFQSWDNWVNPRGPKGKEALVDPTQQRVFLEQGLCFIISGVSLPLLV